LKNKIKIRSPHLKNNFKNILLAVALLGFLANSQARQSRAHQRPVAKGGEIGSGGGEAGSGGDESTDFSARQRDGYYGSCASAVGVLRRALRMARFQNGNFPSVRRILVAGLVNALKELPDEDSPLTKLAVQRGLRLDAQFSGGCRGFNENLSRAQCLDLEVRTAVYFLDKFYGYIVNSVYPLDENYWIPYHANYYPHCRSYDCLPPDFYDSFWVAYKESARSLLDFYVGTPESGIPEALASNLYELRVAEHVLRWSAEDLNMDLFRRRFACAIDDLQEAAQDLADFNAGSSMIFRNSRQAVGFARDTATAEASLLSGNVCGYR
jgi:hypothetical protein